MWLCMYVTLYLCDSVCMWLCMYVTLYVCDSVCMWLCMYVSLHECTYVCMWLSYSHFNFCTSLFLFLIHIIVIRTNGFFISPLEIFFLLPKCSQTLFSLSVRNHVFTYALLLSLTHTLTRLTLNFSHTRVLSQISLSLSQISLSLCCLCQFFVLCSRFPDWALENARRIEKRNILMDLNQVQVKGAKAEEIHLLLSN